MQGDGGGTDYDGCLDQSSRHEVHTCVHILCGTLYQVLHRFNLLSNFGICFLYTNTCSVGRDLPMHVMSTKWISNCLVLMICQRLGLYWQVSCAISWVTCRLAIRLSERCSFYWGQAPWAGWWTRLCQKSSSGLRISDGNGRRKWWSYESDLDERVKVKESMMRPGPVVEFSVRIPKLQFIIGWILFWCESGGLSSEIFKVASSYSFT